MKIALILSVQLLYAAVANTAPFMPQSFSVQFEQSFKKVTGTLETTQGEIYYRSKGNLLLKEFKQEKLNALFVANPKTSWYYLPPIIKGEQGSVQENTSGNIVIAKLFDSLSQGPQDNHLYQLKKHEKPNHLRFLFSKAGQEELKVAEVVIEFALKDILIPSLTEKEKGLVDQARKQKRKSRRSKRNLGQEERLISFSAQELLRMKDLTMNQVGSMKLVYVDMKEVSLQFKSFQENPKIASDDLFNAQDFSFKVPVNTQKLVQ